MSKPCPNHAWPSQDVYSAQIYFKRGGTCVPGQTAYIDEALALLSCAPAVRPLHQPVADEDTLMDDSFLDTMGQGGADALRGLDHGTTKFGSHTKALAKHVQALRISQCSNCAMEALSGCAPRPHSRRLQACFAGALDSQHQLSCLRCCLLYLQLARNRSSL